jgi:hypothetical protein
MWTKCFRDGPPPEHASADPAAHFSQTSAALINADWNPGAYERDPLLSFRKTNMLFQVFGSRRVSDPFLMIAVSK